MAVKREAVALDRYLTEMAQEGLPVSCEHDADVVRGLGHRLGRRTRISPVCCGP